MYLLRTIGLILLCGALAVPGAAQEQEKKLRQTKKDHTKALAKMAEGDFKTVVEHFDKYLEQNPDDLESMYFKAIVHAQNGKFDEAMKSVRQAVDAGLPLGRFLAGPRELTAPLVQSAEFEKYAKARARPLIHGPMLGCVTDRSAKFWVRTFNAAEVQILVSPSKDMAAAIKSPVVKAQRDREYTAVAAVEGLEPNTQYYYQLLIEDRQQPELLSFRTYPPAGQKARFEVGFGGGAGYTPAHEHMWRTITKHELPAFLFLGDNVYIDYPESSTVQQYFYYRRQSRPEYRAFVSGASIYAIWDDHDFVTNDKWGGPEIDEPAWKRPVWNVFKNQWINPSYAGGEAQPGCWFDFSIADVDFIMLDGRYYRDAPKTENPSMLGPAQKRWLFAKLKASKGTFKVLASPVPWALGAKPGSKDPWQGYVKERDEIFAFLAENKIAGVFLISADRHRSDAWKIERPGGYPLYEFESSKLTNVHTHQVMKGSLFGYNAKCSFGILAFDTTQADPTVTYRVINIDDEVIHTLTLKRSQLVH